MIGTTHFDPVWMWTWDEGMASIRSTFKAALNRMEESTGFIYSFSSPAVFEWIKNVDRELFRRIKQKVNEGRWELVHGWWIQPDCNTASGESYVRQGLYAQMYLKENFGRQATTAFNTDSFGHNIMMPQMLKKSGMNSYVFGRPSPKQQTLPADLFNWVSPDGSSVIAFRNGGEGANTFSANLEKDIAALGNKLPEIGHDNIMIYGVTNHGGAPTKKALTDIEKMIDQKGKNYHVKFSTVGEFIGQLDTAPLPDVKDELMVRDVGVFSNNNEVKKNNRLCEYAMLNAEKIAFIADLLGEREYPKEQLKRLWQDVLFNQFHDIIGGASVKPSYFDAANMHGRVLQSAGELLHYSLQSITKDIDTSPEGFPLVVWNPNMFSIHTPVEGEMQWAWEFDWYEGPLRLTTLNGEELPVQVIQEYSALPGFRSRFLFRDTIPSLGYKVYHVHCEQSQQKYASSLQVSEAGLENKRLRVQIDRDIGSIAAVYDKKTGEQILGKTSQFLLREDKGDIWTFNTSGFGPPLGDIQMQSAKIIEEGPLRAILRTKGRFEDAYIEQDFILYDDSDTLEGRFRVDWRGENKVLKLTFDTLIENPQVTSATPYGEIQRNCNGREFPTGEWLDVSGNNRGVSILSDSFFAYDVKDSVAALTLLRSPIFAHLHSSNRPIDTEKDYEHIGWGRHEGSWKLIAHKGDWRENAVPQQAIAFNNPVVTIDEANHPGARPAMDSFAELEANSAIATVLKRAEYGNDTIVRIYEYAGRQDELTLNLPLVGKSCKIKCNEHEIKTLRIKKGDNQSFEEVDNLE